MAGVEQKIVDAGEAGMRLDRWFKIHYPGLGFGHLQKLLRAGQVRVDGGRAKADTRIQAGQAVRIPPLGVDEKAAGPMTAKTIRNQQDGDVLSQMLLYEDPKIFVFNKPAGLAVQGGSGVTRHIDGMLEAWRSKKGEKPRLVHRIDRDTSGVLVVARTRGAAQALTASFRERDTKKTYWALVKGVPRKREDKISTWLVKEQTPDGDKMRVCQHGEPDSDHAVSYYRIIEKAGNNLAWLEMEPYTGRTHQLRVHAPISAIRSSAIRNISRQIRTGNFRAAFKSVFTFMRGASVFPTRRDNRCHGSVAAAYGAIVEPARF
ncbi:ribosomal large subunit pseudouridine synthase C [Brucella ceti TE28753-12]|nr:ribosomal large subunit pseudouridine synthase C [Brucella ceti TE28753-12]